MKVEDADEMVLEVIRDKFYSEETLRPLLETLHAELRDRVAQEEAPQTGTLRKIEQEIANLREALKFGKEGGKATATVMGMLEEAEGRKESLLAAPIAAPTRATLVKVEAILNSLPERVADFLDSLTVEVDGVLADQRRDQRRAFLASLGILMTVYPDHTLVATDNLTGILSTGALTTKERALCVPLVAPTGFEPVSWP